MTVLCRDCGALDHWAEAAERCGSCGSPRVVAHPELAALSIAHITGTKRGGQMQAVLTVGKVAAIAALIVFGLWLGRGDWGNFHSGPEGLLPA